MLQGSIFVKNPVSHRRKKPGFLSNLRATTRIFVKTRFLGSIRPGLENNKSPDFFCEVGALTDIFFGSYCTETASTSTVLVLASEGLPVASDVEFV